MDKGKRSIIDHLVITQYLCYPVKLDIRLKYQRKVSKLFVMLNNRLHEN